MKTKLDQSEKKFTKKLEGLLAKELKSLNAEGFDSMSHKLSFNVVLLNALNQVKNGADVFSYELAGQLRQIQKMFPEVILITKVMNEYDGADRIPYFGAIATKKGRTLIRNMKRILR